MIGSVLRVRIEVLSSSLDAAVGEALAAIEEVEIRFYRAAGIAGEPKGTERPA